MAFLTTSMWSVNFGWKGDCYIVFWIAWMKRWCYSIVPRPPPFFVQFVFSITHRRTKTGEAWKRVYDGYVFWIVYQFVHKFWLLCVLDCLPVFSSNFDCYVFTNNLFTNFLSMCEVCSLTWNSGNKWLVEMTIHFLQYIYF